MKITICNSAFFWEKAKEVQGKLNDLGHEAVTHPMEVDFRGEVYAVNDWYKIRKAEWDDEIERLKEELMREHFNKIMSGDAILVLNHDKNGVAGYVGGNTLIEMGLAFAMRKKIFMLNPVPEEMNYSEEIKGMKPVVLNGNLGGIK